MKFILGRKLNMSQVYRGDGTVVPVTLVEAGPCVITQIKKESSEGYGAVQVGFGFKNKLSRSLAGHLKGLENLKYLKEFKYIGEDLQRGDKINVTTFTAGDLVAVTGFSKGKGFQGVVKRHGFSGSLASHGHKDQLRMPGSIGATGPAHVFKGTRMAGRTGGEQTTIKNLEIIEVNEKNNILAIKGAIPGARGGLILIKGEGELKVVKETSMEKEPQEGQQGSEEKKDKAENKTVKPMPKQPSQEDKKDDSKDKEMQTKEKAE